MKRLLSLIMIVVFCTAANAQVFNTAKTLNKTKFSTTGGFLFYDGGAMLIGNAGYGLGYDNDIALTMGFGDISYLGVDFEKVMPWENLDYVVMSLTGGVHYCGGFGLDATFNCSVPLDKQLELYTGLDLDFLLTDGSGVPISFFAGAEYAVQNRVTVLGEVDLGLKDAGNMLGISVCYYFSELTIK